MTRYLEVAPEASRDVRRLRREAGRVPPATSRDRAVQARVLLAMILVLAAGVRVLGTRFGFPLLTHPDEYAVVDAVIDMAKRNSFEPPWSYRPDHVEMKLDYFVFAAYALLVKGQSIEAAFAADPLPFYHLARLVTAAFGVATVGLAYLIGARWSRRVGLVAAALFALFPPFVMHAHFATPDVPLTFALMLMTYALMRYVDSTSWSSLLVACFSVALAVGIKYPGAVGAVMIALVVGSAAVRDRDWRRFLVHGLVSVAATIGFLFVISPTLFTNLSGIRAELKVQSAGDRLGHPDYGLLGNMKYYASTFVDSSGVVLVLLAFAGLAFVVARRRLWVLPWFTGLLVWVSLSGLPMTWERWGLPMWVTPLLLAAVGLCCLWDRLHQRWAKAAAVAIGMVMAANLVSGSAYAVASLLADDTRIESLAWVRDNGVTRQNSAYEGYTPLLPGAPGLFFDHVRSVGDGYEFTTERGRPATYVVMSSGMYDRVLADPDRPDEHAIYRYVIDNFEEVATFTPTETSQPSKWEPFSIANDLEVFSAMTSGAVSGPTIRIFRVATE
jgi:hypothetical protein